MALFDWLPATRGELKELEQSMNAQIAAFKASMEEKLASVNTKLGKIEKDETGLVTNVANLQTAKADLEARIKVLEDQVANGGTLSTEDTDALAAMEAEYDALVKRVSEIDDAVVDPPAAPPAPPVEG